MKQNDLNEKTARKPYKLYGPERDRLEYLKREKELFAEKILIAYCSNPGLVDYDDGQLSYFALKQAGQFLELLYGQEKI